MGNLKIGDLELNDDVKAILDGIPDIIKIHKPDHTVCFFNKAGYEFYHKNPEDILGKKCYTVLNRNVKCIGCSFEQVLKNKKKISIERYVPELNRIMDVCYNPILDENGEVKLIVERLTDITEKKIIEKMEQSNTEKYIQILDNFSNPIFIVIDNKIVQANRIACSFFDMEYDEIVDSNIYKYFDDKYIKLVHKKIRNTLSNYSTKEDFECDFVDKKNNTWTIQIIFSFMIYEGKPAILVSMRDITQMKAELKNAAVYQRNALQKFFPGEKYLDMVRVYAPANIVSGDFYRICSNNEEEILGILIDVRGKGISAALNISALDILFLQEIRNNNEPLEVVKSLNNQLSDFYEENYIAVCCFKFDMKNNLFQAVGAGINRFFYKPAKEKIHEKIIKGAFLGMFKNSEFSEETIKLNKGDKLFLFTDGFDFILNENEELEDYLDNKEIDEVREYTYKLLEKDILELGKLKDDCTLIAVNVK